jgi:hypothetical protein
MNVIRKSGMTGVPDGFCELATEVYQGDDQWIPEDPQAITAAFSPENTWFQKGTSEVFLIAGKARAAAFIGPQDGPEMVIDGVKAAFFGYWETTEDPEADALLMAEIESWARAQGASALYGPINFTTYGTYRLRTSAEPDAKTFQSESYNPEGYPDVLEGLGFEACQRYLVQISDTESVTKMAAPFEQLIAGFEGMGYRFEPLTPELWLGRMSELHGLVDRTFRHNFAYTPLPYAAFERACGEAFVNKACPHASTLALGPDGSIAGFSLVYPHYGPVITQSAGAARVAVGDLQFAEHAPLLDRARPRVAIAKTLATAPGHQAKGLMGAMGSLGVLKTTDRYDAWFAAMIRSDNHSRRYTKGRHTAERWYALYSKVI